VGLPHGDPSGGSTAALQLHHSSSWAAAVGADGCAQPSGLLSSVSHAPSPPHALLARAVQLSLSHALTPSSPQLNGLHTAALRSAYRDGEHYDSVRRVGDVNSDKAAVPFAITSTGHTDHIAAAPCDGYPATRLPASVCIAGAIPPTICHHTRTLTLPLSLSLSVRGAGKAGGSWRRWSGCCTARAARTPLTRSRC
jgi:hypothetical protein